MIVVFRRLNIINFLSRQNMNRRAVHRVHSALKNIETDEIETRTRKLKYNSNFEPFEPIERKCCADSQFSSEVTVFKLELINKVYCQYFSSHSNSQICISWCFRSTESMNGFFRRLRKICDSIRCYCSNVRKDIVWYNIKVYTYKLKQIMITILFFIFLISSTCYDHGLETDVDLL